MSIVVADFSNEHFGDDKHQSSHSSTTKFEKNQISMSSRKIHQGYYAATDILTVNAVNELKSH